MYNLLRGVSPFVQQVSKCHGWMHMITKRPTREEQQQSGRCEDNGAQKLSTEQINSDSLCPHTCLFPDLESTRGLTLVSTP
jgi:hypothetical protein